MPRVNSLRQLAEQLDLSHATVSAALGGKPGVKPATRARVVAAAEALGYRANPLASALMGELRRSKGGVFRGVIALLAPPWSAEPCARLSAMEAGARARAAEAGFEIASVRIDANDPEPGRLGAILHARGIAGVITLPGLAPARLSELDWTTLCGVHAGADGDQNELHVVRADDQAAMRTAFLRLQSLGYRRPGLVLSGSGACPRLTMRHAAYLACLLNGPAWEQRAYFAPPPFFVEPARAPAPDVFPRWLQRGAHDVVIADTPAVLGWMRSAGAIAPETHGFCLLDREDGDGPCAGVDPQHQLIGARAVDLLREQLLSRQFGRPEAPLVTLVPPRWINGETLREQKPDVHVATDSTIAEHAHEYTRMGA